MILELKEVMRYFVHYLISFIFLSFAIVQWNDPDFYLWMPPYLCVALMAILTTRNIFFRKVYLIILLVFILWMATYIPAFFAWISDGMPTITGSMKAESIYIEFIREFFGLALCILATSFYYYIAKKKHS